LRFPDHHSLELDGILHINQVGSHAADVKGFLQQLLLLLLVYGLDHAEFTASSLFTPGSIHFNSSSDLVYYLPLHFLLLHG
jgi:hypothetical protein